MKTKVQVYFVAVLVCCMAAFSLAQIPATKGQISQVTVYRGQALVTRTIDIDLPAGTSELIVDSLPTRIIPESLFAQTKGDTKVLSVRYRERAVQADTREEVKQLEQQIESVKKQIDHTDSDLKHLHAQWDMFVKLREFTVQAKESDLNRGLLTFEPIEKLVLFIEEKGHVYNKRAIELKDNISALKKELELLVRKRKEIDAGSSRTERQAVLYISNGKKAKGTISLNYLVDGANWVTQYNLRANPDKSNVLIEYNAVVNQTSGEDWKGIELKLSTAEPAMVAAPPKLEPMLVGLSYPPRANQQQMNQTSSVDDSKSFEDLVRSRSETAKKGAKANKKLSEIALGNQVFELNGSRSELVLMQQRIAEIARVEGVSVTYNLPGKLTLPSRSDQQLVSIASVTTKADFTLIATPLLTDYVYLQAEILNDSDTIFLPGPASMFRNGEFVGKSDQQLVTKGSKFVAGFGIDSQVQVTRELEDKQTKIQCGNRIDTYNYRIAVSNFKNSPVKLRLLDRLPYTENQSIKIVLQKTSPQLSQDAEYLTTGNKKGILRWDMNLKPETISQNAAVASYSFTMEYDRNMQIQPIEN